MSNQKFSQPGARQPTESALLPVDPRLCGSCKHASVKETNRGTAYLRCTRAAWDDRLSRYPALPRTDCVGFEEAGNTQAESPQPVPRQGKGTGTD